MKFVRVENSGLDLFSFLFAFLFYCFILFSYFELRVGVSITLYVIVTKLSQVMITQSHVTERCRRLWNNDIILYVNSI